MRKKGLAYLQNDLLIISSPDSQLFSLLCNAHAVDILGAVWPLLIYE